MRIHKRHVRPLFPSFFHIALFINESWIAVQKEASRSKVAPVQILMFKCSWADKAYVMLSQREGAAIHPYVGWCSVVLLGRLLKVVPEAMSSFDTIEPSA